MAMNVVAVLPIEERADNTSVSPFTHVCGESLLAHAIRGLLNSHCVDLVVGVAQMSLLDACRSVIDQLPDPSRCLLIGTPTPCTQSAVAASDHWRPDALLRCLEAITPGEYDIVLIHDPYRPLTPSSNIQSVVDSIADGATAAVPTLPVTDTVKLVDSTDVITRTEDRTWLRVTQSPHGFRESALRAAHAENQDRADPSATLVSERRTVTGHPTGMRIATTFDIAVAEAIFDAAAVG